MIEPEVANWIIKDNPSALNQLIAWIEKIYPEMVDDVFLQLPRSQVIQCIVESIVYEYTTLELDIHDYKMIPCDWFESINLMVCYILINPSIDLTFKRRLTHFGFDLVNLESI